MKSKLVLALAFSLVFGGALAQGKEEKPQRGGGKSQPAPGIDDVLATADETFGILFLANPGKADTFKLQNNQIICVNCLGGGSDTIGSRTLSNPAQTKRHCISSKSC